VAATSAFLITSKEIDLPPPERRKKEKRKRRLRSWRSADDFSGFASRSLGRKLTLFAPRRKEEKKGGRRVLRGHPWLHPESASERPGPGREEKKKGGELRLLDRSFSFFGLAALHASARGEKRGKEKEDSSSARRRRRTLLGTSSAFFPAGAAQDRRGEEGEKKKKKGRKVPFVTRPSGVF